MGTITITIFSVVALVVILNTIIDHLFNWWVREWWVEGNGLVVVPILFYALKTVLFLSLLYDLLR